GGEVSVVYLFGLCWAFVFTLPAPSSPRPPRDSRRTARRDPSCMQTCVSPSNRPCRRSGRSPASSEFWASSTSLVESPASHESQKSTEFAPQVSRIAGRVYHDRLRATRSLPGTRNRNHIAIRISASSLLDDMGNFRPVLGIVGDPQGCVIHLAYRFEAANRMR